MCKSSRKTISFTPSFWCCSRIVDCRVPFAKTFWVMPSTVVNLLAWWKGKFARHNNDNWKTHSLCIMTCIWNERNAQFWKVWGFGIRIEASFCIPSIIGWQLIVISLFQNCWSLSIFYILDARFSYQVLLLQTSGGLGLSPFFAYLFNKFLVTRKRRRCK